VIFYEATVSRLKDFDTDPEVFAFSLPSHRRILSLTTL